MAVDNALRLEMVCLLEDYAGYIEDDFNRLRQRDDLYLPYLDIASRAIAACEPTLLVPLVVEGGTFYSGASNDLNRMKEDPNMPVTVDVIPTKVRSYDYHCPIRGNFNFELRNKPESARKLAASPHTLIVETVRRGSQNALAHLLQEVIGDPNNPSTHANTHQINVLTLFDKSWNPISDPSTEAHIGKREVLCDLTNGKSLKTLKAELLSGDSKGALQPVREPKPRRSLMAGLSTRRRATLA